MKKKTGIKILASIAGILIFGGALLFFSGNQMTVANCIVTENGSLFMVYHERPVQLNYGKKVDYKTGDTLFIIHSTAFAESYPEQTRTAFIMQIGSGFEEDIPQKALDILRELDEPTGSFSGMYGAYWELDEESTVCVYYNGESDTIMDVFVYHETSTDGEQ